MNAVVQREPQDSKIIPATDAPMVAMIERIVMDPSIPIDRLEQMLAMKERMEDRAREDGERQAKKAYFAAMSKCQAELPVVVKRRKNTFPAHAAEWLAHRPRFTWTLLVAATAFAFWFEGSM